MKQLALAAALALSTSLSAAPLWAQTEDSYEARLAVAEAYTEQTLADMDMEGMIRSMYSPMIDMMRQQGREVSEEQIAQIHDLYMRTLMEPLVNIMRNQSAVMAELFTLEEITALAEFYGTPAGRAVMRKLPQVMERSQPEIMTLVQTTTPQIIPELQRILGE